MPRRGLFQRRFSKFGIGFGEVTLFFRKAE
ncbi:MAG: hypothetical protein RL434_3080 [Pseudomonadota bacterium]|jgi:hypothetical protein